jgi:Rrf2 family protein
MKFSSQEEYGLRCLLQLALRGDGGAVTIAEISEAEGLSPSYTAKLLRQLRLTGFIDSARGQEGGYSLARPAQDIAVGAVLDALGGRFYEADFCSNYPGSEESCAHALGCALRGVWVRVQGAIDGALAGITIADLAADAQGVALHDLQPAGASLAAVAFIPLEELLTTGSPSGNAAGRSS